MISKTLKPYILEKRNIYTKHIEVNGNVFISGDIKIRDPRVHSDIYKNGGVLEHIDDLDSSITVDGDLYIDCNVVYTGDAQIFSSVIIKGDEKNTKKMNIYPKNVCFQANKLYIYGLLRINKNISIYSDEVLTKIRGEKIKKIKENIKDKTYE